MQIDSQRLARFDAARLLPEAQGYWQEYVSGQSPYAPFLGWLSARGAAWGALDAIKEKAREIRERADALVVVGIGGSNHAARAVIEALGARGIEIVWMGTTLSAHEIARQLQSLEGKSIYIDVIAKNFETLEPGSHYRLLRKWMEQRYSREEMAARVILTGTTGSRLNEIARENGHLFLPFPEPIGGRYSAFSPVALLPIAAAGLDVDAYLDGAAAIENGLRSGQNIDALRFACWRNACLRVGFDIEVLTAFEPRLKNFALWWRQLFGESEGKEGKGIFPAFMGCSEDLHSMGQYMQEGARRLLETFIRVEDPGASVPVPADPGFGDRFDYLDGQDFADINRAAEAATLGAHEAGGVPCAVVSVPALSERAFGELFYFFLAAVSVSARLNGVNPFDQNGVEAYKKSMFAALGKK